MAYSNITPPTLPEYGSALYNGEVAPEGYAYYNGVLLNTVPHHEDYPYVIIFNNGSGYYFIRSQLPFYYTEEYSGHFVRHFGNCAYWQYLLSSDGSGWRYYNDASDSFCYIAVGELIWSNHDVFEYVHNGSDYVPTKTLYLSASEHSLYAHYVLEFEYENGSENWFAVSLRYSSTPFTYDGAAVTNAGEHHLQTYGSGTGEWTYWGTLTEMSIAPGTTSTGGYRRIWTNHNILDGSGNVWLAANTATPAEANLDRLSIMKSKLAGLIMAWCAPVRQFPQREPVEFLYGHVAKEGETPTHTINGVGYVGLVAPDIYSVYTLERQEKYPYAVLFQRYSDGSYLLRLCVSIQYTVRLGSEDLHVADYYPNEDDTWVLDYEYVETDSGIEPAPGWNAPGKIIWTSKNILDWSQNIYFEATNPIPVYK